jgi:hypothetical protein
MNGNCHVWQNLTTRIMHGYNLLEGYQTVTLAKQQVTERMKIMKVIFTVRVLSLLRLKLQTSVSCMNWPPIQLLLSSVTV